MYSTHSATLPIPLFPQAAKEAHTFVELGDTSLVSLGPLVDAGCTVAIDATSCSISYQGQEVLSGTRNAPHQPLWIANLKPTLSANLTVKRKLVDFEEDSSSEPSPHWSHQKPYSEAGSNPSPYSHSNHKGAPYPNDSSTLYPIEQPSTLYPIERPTKCYCDDSNTYGASTEATNSHSAPTNSSVPDSFQSPEALQLLANHLATATQAPVPDTLAATAEFLANLPDGCLELKIDDFHPQNQAYAAAIGNSATPADLVAFAHASLFSPSVSTLETALRKGFLPPFPGLTLKSLQKYPPKSEATTMGHLDNIRKNLKSTKQQANYTEVDPDDFPTQPTDTTRTNTCFLAS